MSRADAIARAERYFDDGGFVADLARRRDAASDRADAARPHCRIVSFRVIFPPGHLSTCIRSKKRYSEQ